jgi:hypothetical protein
VEVEQIFSLKLSAKKAGLWVEAAAGAVELCCELDEDPVESR